MKNESADAIAIAADSDDACTERADVAAYLDGELDADSTQAFEQHIVECAECRESLAEQRRTLVALNGAFGLRGEVELPQEFAQKVTARARTDMSGVRSRRERRRALRFCLVLAVAVFVLLGSTSSRLVLERAGFAWRAFSSIVNLVGQAAGDLGAGMLVLMRALSGGTANESGVAPFLLGVFLLALLLLLRLVGAYRSGEQSS